VGEGALAAVGGPGGRSASLYKSLNQHVPGYHAEKYSRSILLSQRVFQGHWQPKGHVLDRALGANSIFNFPNTRVDPHLERMTLPYLSGQNHGYLDNLTPRSRRHEASGGHFE